MPASVYSSPQAQNVNVVTTAETVVATLSGITTDGPSRRITLLGEVEFTTGTGITALVLRLRRGIDTTGAVVGVAETNTPVGAAGSTDNYSIEASDTPGDVNNQSYVLTVAQTGATTNGTAVSAQITGELA